ncbi:MAG TPA: tRNA (adenosine(37)-N6)-dimethylallyltransferase MiaA [Verrucomicrobiae bacterium]|nr:tRNA (adenosine(37)-N6)-dimethylallyltransferase MiaA [Verrucomicrobiae bacterium]
MTPTLSPPLLGLCGPTAGGKTEVALLLAERLGGEVISVDSMQVYRGMDIGTAKVSVVERSRIPHHLIDIRDISEPFSVADFVRLAGAAAGEIQARGRLPILCGGTGLYFKALLEGLGAAPAGNPDLRRELELLGMAQLLKELAARDPDTYERIDRQNPRRVIRAVEVLRLTGKPLSDQKARWSNSNPAGMPLFGLAPAAGELRQRIERRVERMFRAGLVSETEELLKRGLAQNPVALQALGYRQVSEFLQGARSLPETIELVKIRTRQFAKRQLTWFRRQLAVSWLVPDPSMTSAVLAEQVAGRYTAATPGAGSLPH